MGSGDGLPCPPAKPCLAQKGLPIHLPTLGTSGIESVAVYTRDCLLRPIPSEGSRHGAGATCSTCPSIGFLHSRLILRWSPTNSFLSTIIQFPVARKLIQHSLYALLHRTCHLITALALAYVSQGP
jgi:hypothetical protein